MKNRTRPGSDHAQHAIESLPNVIETIRNAYAAHIEFASAVRLAVNFAQSANDPAMDRAALAQIASALDVIST